jgi:tetratricopeptide (TPR) repeat protein
MGAKRPIGVFIASPSDLAVERRAFYKAVEELNGEFAEGANVRFEPLRWEDKLAAMRVRAQESINADIDRADVFILSLHCRWGQEAPDAKPYTSYTEEEFHRALDRWRKTGVPEVIVLLKRIPPIMMADPGEQLQKVLKFRRELEAKHEVIFREFDNEPQFVEEVKKHLKAYARGDLLPDEKLSGEPILPLEYVTQVTEAKEAARKEAERAEAAGQQAAAANQQAEAANQRAEALAARNDEFALILAEQAAKAALDGRVEEARQTFAKATDGTNNLDILDLASEFYERIGELAAAEQMLERCLAISGLDAETANTAAAYGNLGLIYQTRGELDRAEEMHKKSLAIEETLGRQEGMASDYGNLGGDLPGTG